MIEVIDMVRDWIDGPHGVNYHLQLLSVLPGDAIPDNIGAVYSHHRNAQLCRGELPTRSGSFLVVQQNGPWQVDPNAAALMSIIPGMPIAIWYVTANTNTDKAERDTMYTITALRRCLYEFINKAPSSNRIRNNIQIMTVMNTQIEKAKEDIGQSSLRAVLIVTYRVRDILAGDTVL